MSLGDVVNRTPSPFSAASLVRDLAALGVRPGEVVLVHCSLSALGWVNGGAQAVVEALVAAVGRRGTLVMPSQTGENSNPALWCNPPVPDSWWADIAATMPAYHPGKTPSRGMGTVAELFRTWPGARRSEHPQQSFAARGRLARRILSPHRLDEPFGPGSPLERLEARGARVLLLGAGWDSCTALHLAECRADWANKTAVTEWAALERPAWRLPGTDRRFGPRRREWASFTMTQFDTGDFQRLGADFEAACSRGECRGRAGRPALATGEVGLADCRLADLAVLVRFAEGWFARERLPLAPECTILEPDREP